jgi:hypothetical protein
MPLGPIADFYDKLYYGLVITFNRSDSRAGQVASAGSTLAVFEAWYWFVSRVAVDQARGRVNAIFSLRLELICVFLLLGIANIAYFYKRHPRVEERLGGDDLWPAAFYVAALVFYAGPIVALGFLLWLRN